MDGGEGEHDCPFGVLGGGELGVVGEGPGSFLSGVAVGGAALDDGEAAQQDRCDQISLFHLRPPGAFRPCSGLE